MPLITDAKDERLVIFECSENCEEHQNEILDSLRAALQERDAAISERNAWEESAAQFSRNEDYYRGLIVRVGKVIGPAAFVSDDGSVQEDVLCAKVPELVVAALAAKEKAEGALIDDRGCDTCRGGCPDKDHHVTRKFCEECFQSDYIKPIKWMQDERNCLIAAKEAAETGSFRVDAGIEHFLERWDYVTQGKKPHDPIMIDVLEDVVATLRTQRRKEET